MNEIDTCKICRNNRDGYCRVDWGCCFDPDPSLISYLEQLGKLFGDK
ncbi:MAG: hypothetical protein ACFFDN_00415 [Candidatus Hodarchaeota archaeon]